MTTLARARRLVHPLEAAWQEVLERELTMLAAPPLAALSPLVRELSATYNDGTAPEDARSLPLLGARLGFSFPRDVPKGAAAVRELVASGLLALPRERALLVTDLGAGLGAMSFGVTRALAAAGLTGEVAATCIDADARALGIAGRLAHAVPRHGEVSLVVRTKVASLGGASARWVAAVPEPRADLVILGQVLSELDRDADDERRAELHADAIASLLDRATTDAGAVVVVEPALLSRTRHLHRVRSALVARGVTVFAPCLHAAVCPMLASETDWCHEDLPVDLPPWLVPVARGAGLRFQGLTFSYLVVRKDGQALSGFLPEGPRLRLVSRRLGSKGKEEAYTCGTTGSLEGRVVLRRLDRDRSEANRDWDDLERGDVVSVSPAPEAGTSRVGREATVRRLV